MSSISKINLSVLGLVALTALSVSGCNTVDRQVYASASCDELKALAQSFDSQASAPSALLNQRETLSRRTDIDQERLLNTRRSHPFKQQSAIRAAYKKNGC